MDKKVIDELYHNLRELCVTEDIQQKEAVLGITTHLTIPGGDYNGLLKFLAYYGENYLLPHAIKILESNRVQFTRIVEFGAGLGWLGRGLSNAAKGIPVVFVDKRQYVFTDLVADLETIQGSKGVLEQMRDGDLIVMSELLHCLDDPEKVLRPFTKWPMLVIEYWPWSSRYKLSYDEQIAKFDCAPIKDFRSVFPGSRITSSPLEPHAFLLVQPL